MDREEFWTFLAEWIFGLARASKPALRPLLVGLSAPQGAGKTTLTRELVRRAAVQKLRVISLSIDDFYLTHDEQAQLARQHPTNPYLQHRGYPGTHDVKLGTRTLVALKNIGDHGGVAVPSYDKTEWNGAGDRRPESNWPVVEAPLDIVILEGWMLGFTPVAPGALPDTPMTVINESLIRYAPWTAALDALVWLEPKDPHFMLEWRIEAEERSKAEGNPGMTSDAIKAFAETFLPAYATYLPTLRNQPSPRPFLHVVIERNRLPSSMVSTPNSA